MSSISQECPACHSSPEHARHTFFDCPAARQVWSFIPRSTLWLSFTGSSFKDMLAKISQTETELNVSLFITTLWFLWFNRNKTCFEGQSTDASSLAQQIQAFAEENLSALEARKSRMLLAAPGIEKWRKPSEGLLKVNVDAAWTEDFCGIGAIRRDHNGTTLAAMTKTVSHVHSALHGESLAALEGLRFAHCNGVEHLVLESDSLILINKLSSGDNDLSELGSFFSSIKTIYSSLSFISLSHVGRNGNVPAHLLAQKKGET